MLDYNNKSKNIFKKRTPHLMNNKKVKQQNSNRLNLTFTFSLFAWPIGITGIILSTHSNINSGLFDVA